MCSGSDVGGDGDAGAAEEGGTAADQIEREGEGEGVEATMSGDGAGAGAGEEEAEEGKKKRKKKKAAAAAAAVHPCAACGAPASKKCYSCFKVRSRRRKGRKRHAKGAP